MEANEDAGLFKAAVCDATGKPRATVEFERLQGADGTWAVAMRKWNGTSSPLQYVNIVERGATAVEAQRKFELMLLRALGGQPGWKVEGCA